MLTSEDNLNKLSGEWPLNTRQLAYHRFFAIIRQPVYLPDFKWLFTNIGSFTFLKSRFVQTLCLQRY